MGEALEVAGRHHRGLVYDDHRARWDGVTPFPLDPAKQQAAVWEAMLASRQDVGGRALPGDADDGDARALVGLRAPRTRASPVASWRTDRLLVSAEGRASGDRGVDGSGVGDDRPVGVVADGRVEQAHLSARSMSGVVSSVSRLPIGVLSCAHERDAGAPLLSRVPDETSYTTSRDATKQGAGTPIGVVMAET